MGPINSLDPPAGALSNPSNGKDPVSVRDWCQRHVKPPPAHPDARYKMQDARSARPPNSPTDHTDKIILVDLCSSV
jgi:hypothetical protein